MDWAASNIAGSFAGSQQAARVRAAERRERAARASDGSGASDEGDRFDAAAPIEEASTDGEQAGDSTDQQVRGDIETGTSPVGRGASTGQEISPADEQGGSLDIRG